jgi:hypothetical protein
VDQRAEDAYANGGSIQSLIAHYRQRRQGESSGSPEYSRLTTRINQLIDQAQGEDLALGEQRILDKINHGEASYSDLVAFYQKKLRGLRGNSQLKDDIVTRLTIARHSVSKQDTDE